MGRRALVPLDVTKNRTAGPDDGTQLMGTESSTVSALVSTVEVAPAHGSYRAP